MSHSSHSSLSKHHDALPPFSVDIPSILKQFSSDPQTGLSSERVTELRSQHGYNTLPEKKRPTLVAMFFAQLNDWLVYILAAAVGITALMGEWVDAIIILLVILINAVLGVVQEYRAGKALEALRKMSSSHVFVRRDSITQEIDSTELVPGDIVILDAGRIVTADLRLIETEELEIEESALTGESVPVKKRADAVYVEANTPIGDRKNMAYMSTIVTSGRGTGIVVATAGNTEVGNIAHIMDHEEEVITPLERRLEHLGKTLGKLAILICVVMFAIALFQGRELMDTLLLAVSLAVASIPEGLVAIVAVVLSIGVTKMSKKNAIVKHLHAVETLGSVDVICSDKTGTLTENRMTVTEVFSFERNRVQ